MTYPFGSFLENIPVFHEAGIGSLHFRQSKTVGIVSDFATTSNAYILFRVINGCFDSNKHLRYFLKVFLKNKEYTIEMDKR